MMRFLPVAVLLLLVRVLKPEAGVFYLEHADLLRNTSYQGRSIRELLGNVRIRYVDLWIDCDRAKYYEAAEKMVCRGDVVITHGRRVLTARTVTYFEAEERLEAQGDVTVREDSLFGACIRAVYWRRTQRLRMHGNAVLEDRERHIILTAQQLDYDHVARHAWTRSRPVLRMEHPEQGKITVRADSLDYLRPEHRETAVGKVRITMKEITARADTFVYNDSLQWGRLWGAASLRHRERTITGGVLELWTQGEELERLVVTGDALVESPADSVDRRLVNRLSGDTLRFDLVENTIRRIEALGKAGNVYFAREESGRPGVNIVSGKSMDIELDPDGIRSIRVTGGARGSYYPLQEDTLRSKHGHSAH